MRYVVLTLLILGLHSCKKYPGDGGMAAIKGKIYVREYNESYTQLLDEYYVGGEDVYIIYGDNEIYDDNVETNYDGSFIFKELRKGNYTIFVYTEDSTFTVPGGQYPIFQEVEITGRKEIVDIGEIEIIKS